MDIANKLMKVAVGPNAARANEVIDGWIADSTVSFGGHDWTKCVVNAAKECDAFAKSLIKVAAVISALTWCLPSMVAFVGFSALVTAVVVFDLKEIIQHFPSKEKELPELDTCQKRASWA